MRNSLIASLLFLLVFVSVQSVINNSSSFNQLSEGSTSALLRMTRQAAEFKGQFVGNFNCEYECRYDSVGAANNKSWGRRCGRCCCCCCPWGQCLFHHHRCCRRRRPWPPYPEPPYDDSGEDDHSPWDNGEIGSSKGAGGQRKTPTP